MQSGAGQLGNLGALASGQLAGPTAADRELIAQSIGAARQMAESQLASLGPQLAARAREDITARGGQASSAETLSQLLNTLGTQQSIAQAILGAQQQGGQALLNLPFQRGAMQLEANRELFNRLIGAAQPALQVPLQERLTQMTQTQTQSGFGLGDLFQLGTSLPFGLKNPLSFGPFQLGKKGS